MKPSIAPPSTRAHTQHSTGLKTEAGKQRSLLNALRHGVPGQIVVMPSEELQACQLHVESFTAAFDPQGAEAHRVQVLAHSSWRQNSVAALETDLLNLGTTTHGSPIADAPQQVQSALSIAAALESQSKALANLSVSSQRLSRQFERTLAQLRDLQKTRRARRGQEKHQLDDLIDIIEMYEDTGEAFAPPSMASFFQPGKSPSVNRPAPAPAWHRRPTNTATHPPRRESERCK